jgi:hypothetical protein
VGVYSAVTLVLELMLGRNPALESRVLIGYVVAFSCLVLGLQRLYRTAALQSFRTRVFGPVQHVPNEDFVPKGGYVARHGGSVIFSFQITRFLSNTALTALLVAQFLSERSAGTTFLLAAAVRLFVCTMMHLLELTLCRPMQPFYPSSCSPYPSHNLVALLPTPPFPPSPFGPVISTGTCGRL